MDAYRFVVAFRREKRSGAGAPPTWRGWVEQVYPFDGTEMPTRRWFVDVAQVSALTTDMIRSSGGSDDGTD